MLADIFESAEIVRVIDFLLDDLGREYTKTEIAEGASVSRPTLYKMWDRLERLEILRPARRFGKTELYRLDSDSEVVKSLMKFDFELANAMMRAGISTPESAAISVSIRGRGRK